jgi:AbrB family looped-hinge helix DNA binding protein
MNAVTSKGQVTIPKAIRDHLDIGPGSKVDFAMNDQGDIVLRKAETERPARGSVSRFSRFLGVLKTDMTTDEIMALTRGED